MTKIVPLLPNPLYEEKLWRDVFTTFDEVVGEPLHQRIDKLKNRHNIDKLFPHPRNEVKPVEIDNNDTEKSSIVVEFSNLLGFHYNARSSTIETSGGNTQIHQDFFDTDDYFRFVLEATRFISHQGTSKFVDFFAYMFGNEFDFDVLWYDPTRQTLFKEDATEIAGRRLVVDGTTDSHNVYPTPYVRLNVDVDYLRNNDIQPVIDLFYSIAPMDIVVGEVSAETVVEPDNLLISCQVIIEVEETI